jgi:hypothetical protein
LAEGYPDLEVPARDGALMRVGFMTPALHPIVLKKLGDAYQDAQRKFARVNADGQRREVVWVKVEGFDWPTSRSHAWQVVEEWTDAIQGDGAPGLVL